MEKKVQRGRGSTDEDVRSGYQPLDAELTLKSVYREVFVVTCGIFMGYSACVILQHKLKDQLDKNFGGDGMSDSEQTIFEHGTSCNYIGNLIFRLFHNVFFSCMVPRHRVFLSLLFMICSMLIIALVFFVAESTALAWVYIAYFLCGVSVGSFESNLLSCITMLGHDTKVWAILGLPFGFNLNSIVGFALMSQGMPPELIYFATVAVCVCGILVWFFLIPDVPVKNNSQTFPEFLQNLKQWKEWFPLIWTNCLALAIDMFCVSFFTSWGFYIYDDDQVPLYGKHTDYLLDSDAFFAIVNTCTFLGDFVSRKCAYMIPEVNALWYCLVNALGVVLCLTETAICLPFGMFFIFYANGSIYATTTRFIDSHVAKEFNLISLSVWLFIGDFGSVTGSNTWESATKQECKHIHAAHYCTDTRRR